MKAAEEENSFEYVLSAAIKEAEKALANTVYQNPVLEKAGVVDAGGKGWLLVMQAMLHALNKDDVSYSPKSNVATDTKEKADFSSFDT
jgi:dihydroxyacetone kinase-like predicted kinase